MILDIITVVFLVIGSLFILVAAVGILRLPDLYLRMSSTTKAATLGVGCILFAVALHFEEVGLTARAVAVIFFLFITAPVAAHVLARASYFLGIPLWTRAGKDELKGRYDKITHILSSEEKKEIKKAEEEFPK